MKGRTAVLVSVAVFAVAAAIAVPRWFDEEPAVYLAAIEDGKYGQIAVASIPSTCRAGDKNLTSISPDLAAAFRSANRPDAGFARLSPLSRRVAIANSAKLRHFDSYGPAQHEAGEERLPILRLSRVGFTNDKKEALFCAGGRYGSGLIHLRKIDGKWRVEEYISLWST